jgi:hypothetical protein
VSLFVILFASKDARASEKSANAWASRTHIHRDAAMKKKAKKFFVCFPIFRSLASELSLKGHSRRVYLSPERVKSRNHWRRSERAR